MKYLNQQTLRFLVQRLFKMWRWKAIKCAWYAEIIFNDRLHYAKVQHTRRSLVTFYEILDQHWFHCRFSTYFSRKGIRAYKLCILIYCNCKRIVPICDMFSASIELNLIGRFGNNTFFLLMFHLRQKDRVKKYSGNFNFGSFVVFIMSKQFHND